MQLHSIAKSSDRLTELPNCSFRFFKYVFEISSIVVPCPICSCMSFSKIVKNDCLIIVAYKSSIFSESIIFFSLSVILFEILSYNSSSEKVDAVSANGNGASCTRMDLSCAAWLCTAWPNSWAKVKTSLDFPVKLTKTKGVIFGVIVLQNAPSLFPVLMAESMCFSSNTFLANLSSFGLNLPNDSKTSFTDFAYG